MKTKLFNPTMLAAALIATMMATGCTTAWWDTTISPYDYFDDPMAPPPPGLYPLPSRPIFYPNGYGPATPPPPPPGWSQPSNRPPVNNQRPPQNGNQKPPQNSNQKPPQNGNTQRPGGNVKPGTSTGNSGSTTTTGGNTGSGSHSTTQRRGGNVK